MKSEVNKKGPAILYFLGFQAFCSGIAALIFLLFYLFGCTLFNRWFDITTPGWVAWFLFLQLCAVFVACCIFEEEMK